MQSDHDFKMALILQQQFNTEFTVENPSEDLSYQKKKHKPVHKSPSKCLTDPSWELVDPTPNIFILFVQFNRRFFWDKLLAVSVSWSKRMTTCAGICSYQGRGGLCKITLSEPLLKLRPRKDLIETLLHEMIHAFLFVTHNNRDRDGHGPEFHKHMHRINVEAGTNITVYHDFHDEVRLYKQHWWRCDGPCHKKPPYFGMVRRAMNRAPGPNDRWWAQHQQNCGGKYIKVKEPEKPGKTKIISKPISPKKSPHKSKSLSNLPDIRNFLPVVGNTASTSGKISTINDLKTGAKNLNGTVVLNPTKNKTNSNTDISAVIPGSNNANIKGFTNSVSTKNPNIEIFSGPGKKLSETKTKTNSNPDISAVIPGSSTANIKGFTNSVSTKNPNIEIFSGSGKKLSETKTKTNSNTDISAVISGSSNANIKGFTNSVPTKNPNIEIFSGPGKKLSETSDFNNGKDRDYSTVRNHWANKFNNPINNNLKRKSLDFESPSKKSKSENKNTKPAENISSKSANINCPNCDKLISATEINSHLDNCLNADDTITSEFSDESFQLIECPVCKTMIDEDILNTHLDDCLSSNNDEAIKMHCEICSKYFTEPEFNSHVQECLNKCYDNIEKEFGVQTVTSESVLCLVCNKDVLKTDLNLHLEDCMGSVFDKDKFNGDDDDDDSEIVDDNNKKYNCPICMVSVDETNMNRHIDECLNNAALKNEDMFS